MGALFPVTATSSRARIDSLVLSQDKAVLSLVPVALKTQHTVGSLGRSLNRLMAISV